MTVASRPITIPDEQIPAFAKDLARELFAIVQAELPELTEAQAWRLVGRVLIAFAAARGISLE